MSKAQPVGRTAAASRILMMSPMMCGFMLTLKAASGGVCKSTINQAQPARRITSEPTAIATTAVRKRLSQPFSAKAPVMKAAAGKATR